MGDSSLTQHVGSGRFEEENGQQLLSFFFEFQFEIQVGKEVKEETKRKRENRRPLCVCV